MASLLAAMIGLKKRQNYRRDNDSHKNVFDPLHDFLRFFSISSLSFPKNTCFDSSQNQAATPR